MRILVLAVLIAGVAFAQDKPKGRGELVDASTNQPVTSAVVRIAWTMRRVDGMPGTRVAVQQKRVGVQGAASRFYVSASRLPGPNLPGWEIAPGTRPMVRVYAKGYKRSADIRWEDKGAVVKLVKLPETRDALVAQLREWRRDIDADLGGLDREAAIASVEPLLTRLGAQCDSMTPDLRAGICFEAGSDVARLLPIVRARAPQFIELDDGPPIRVVTTPPPVAQASSAPGATYGAMGLTVKRNEIGGFSIEPVEAP